jgi:hypothetical protein
MSLNTKIIIRILLIAIFVFVGCSKGTKVPPIVDSNQLKDTIIASNIETTEIYKGKNIIYCSTFQLAWNELRNNIVKEDIKLQGGENSVAKLNNALSTKNDISESNYVAIVDF